MINLSTCPNLASSYVTKIDDIEFFQGDTVVLPFKFLDSNGNVIPVRQSDYFCWYLCPYGNYDMPVLVLDSRTDTENIWRDTSLNVYYVKITNEQTKYLDYGKYAHQPVLFASSGTGMERFQRAEGIILLKRKIAELN